MGQSIAKCFQSGKPKTVKVKEKTKDTFDLKEDQETNEQEKEKYSTEIANEMNEKANLKAHVEQLENEMQSEEETMAKSLDTVDSGDSTDEKESFEDIKLSKEERTENSHFDTISFGSNLTSSSLTSGASVAGGIDEFEKEISVVPKLEGVKQKALLEEKKKERIKKEKERKEGKEHEEKKKKKKRRSIKRITHEKKAIAFFENHFINLNTTKKEFGNDGKQKLYQEDKLEEPYVIGVFGSIRRAKRAIAESSEHFSFQNENKKLGDKSNHVICTKPWYFGYYKKKMGNVERGERRYEAFVYGEMNEKEIEQIKKSFSLMGAKQLFYETPEIQQPHKSQDKTDEDKIPETQEENKEENQEKKTKKRKIYKCKFVRTQKAELYKYYIYKTKNLESAREFLEKGVKIKQPYVYVIVKTKEGTLGKDIQGIYQEEEYDQQKPNK